MFNSTETSTTQQLNSAAAMYLSTH